MAIKIDSTTVIDDSRNLTNINSLDTATWEAGVSTTETVVSPAKVKAAIDAVAPTQVTATWEAGTDTTESLVSAAKVKAAIDALTPSSAASTKLGTLTTTSGTSHSLTGLDLTSYKFIMAVFNGVSSQVSFTNSIYFAGSLVAVTNSASDTRTGMVIVDVERGQGFYVISGASGGALGIDTNITSASTTITVSITGTNAAFDAGTVEIYGVT